MDDTDTLVLAAMLQELVEEPVERKGILSRIERHIANQRELLTMYDIDAPSLALRLEKIDGNMATVKETLMMILKQQELYNASLMALSGALESIDSRLYGIESKDKSLTGLIELQRRVTRLEQRDERGYVDVPAGSSGSETAAAQGDGQAGTGRVPD